MTTIEATASEIGAAGVPGLPKSKSKILALWRRQGWPSRREKRRGSSQTEILSLAKCTFEQQAYLIDWRARQERARASEQQQVQLTPPDANADVTILDVAGNPIRPIQPTEPIEAASRALWARFDRAPRAAKDRAQARLDAVLFAAEQIAAGTTKGRARKLAAEKFNFSIGAIRSFQKRLRGVAETDRLPGLLDEFNGRPRPPAYDEQIYDFLKTFFLREGRPTWAASYRLAIEAVRNQGFTGAIPSLAALRRRLLSEVDRRAIVLAREGRDGLEETFPHRRRARTIGDGDDCRPLHAFEALNADGFKTDNWVRWPDGRVLRPIIVVVQDVGFNAIVSYRISPTENADAIRLALLDAMLLYRILCDILLIDNGSAFNALVFTGGKPTRSRKIIPPGEPLGSLRLLAIKLVNSLPWAGRAKIIERFFGDVQREFCRHPRLAPSYCGPRPEERPESARHPIKHEEFVALFGDFVSSWNARPRSAGQLRGRSAIEAFQDDLARNPRRAAPEAAVRLAFLPSRDVLCHRDDGHIELLGNFLWAPFLQQLAGQRVTLRFDPDNLRSGANAYGKDESLLGAVECIRPTGFFSTRDAREVARLKGVHRRAAREALDAARRIDLIQATNALPAPKPPAGGVAAKVVRPFRMPLALPNARYVPPPADPADEVWADYRATKDRIARGEGSPEDRQFVNLFEHSDSFRLRRQSA